MRWCPLWVPSWACTESGSSGRGRCWVERSDVRKEGKFTPQVQIMTTRRNEAVTMFVIYSLDTVCQYLIVRVCMCTSTYKSYTDDI